MTFILILRFLNYFQALAKLILYPFARADQTTFAPQCAFVKSVFVAKKLRQPRQQPQHQCQLQRQQLRLVQQPQLQPQLPQRHDHYVSIVTL